MKYNCRKLGVHLLIASIFALMSCVDDDDNGNILPRPSAYDRIADSADHTILKQALDLTGLDLNLKNSGSFTVFAPTDAAFNTYFTTNNITDLSAIPVAQLRNLLLYHVLQTIERDTDFVTGYFKTSALNPQGEILDVYVQIVPDVLLNNAVSINRANVTANNGVLHYTDRVLEILTLDKLLLLNPDFSTLTTALVQENLLDALQNTNTTGPLAAPFTVFAPDDNAFQAFINESTTDPINSVADILALPNLSDILLYHVVSGNAYRSSDFRDGFIVDPIATGTFTTNNLNNTTTITDAAAREINFGQTDIVAINGNVHIIGNVLSF